MADDLKQDKMLEPLTLARPSRNASYSDLFDRLLDSIFILDIQTHKIIEVNPAAEKFVEISEESLIGRELTEWVDESMRMEFDKSLRAATRRYHPRLFDCQWHLPDGRALIVEIMACPLTLLDRSEVLQVVARNVNFLRKADQEMRFLLDELQAAYAKVALLSTVDEMTGLSNYRHFKSRLADEHARSIRTSRPYAILFCDIDFFKAYNDRNGHPAGDALLALFGKKLKEICRSTDFPVRYGGEEFVVLCPDVGPEKAMVLAERIRSTVENTAFEFSAFQPGGKVTISVGVAGFPGNGETSDAVLEAADQAVYQSKAQGRNRVTLALTSSSSESRTP